MKSLLYLLFLTLVACGGEEGGSTKADSAKTDSAKADSTKTDNAKADSTKTDSIKTDSAKVDSAKVDSAKVDSNTGGNVTNPNINDGQDFGFNTLEKFKQSVKENKWGQYKDFAKYNTYKFKYINPSSSQKCFGNVFKICLDFDSTPTSVIHTTQEVKGKVTKPLIELSKIKKVVKQAYAGSSLVGGNAYYQDGYWFIQINNEYFVFNPGFPLGGNPVYYRNSSGLEYSLAHFEYSNQ